MATAAEIPSWRRVGVFTAQGEKCRFFELHPGDLEDEITFGEFRVRGKFTIARKVNNPKLAVEARKALEAV